MGDSGSSKTPATVRVKKPTKRPSLLRRPPSTVEDTAEGTESGSDDLSDLSDYEDDDVDGRGVRGGRGGASSGDGEGDSSSDSDSVLFEGLEIVVAQPSYSSVGVPVRRNHRNTAAKSNGHTPRESPDRAANPPTKIIRAGMGGTSSAKPSTLPPPPPPPPAQQRQQRQRAAFARDDVVDI